MKTDLSEKNIKRKEEIKETLLLTLTGVCTGIANGFFGGGGGMIVVPMLVLLLEREPKKAHATAILIILPISIVSGLVYALYGKFPFAEGLPSIAGVVVGGIIGALSLKRIPNGILTKVFAVIMFAAGVKMAFF